MSEQVVIAIIVSLLGGGGLGGVIVSAIFQPQKSCSGLRGNVERCL